MRTRVLSDADPAARQERKRGMKKLRGTCIVIVIPFTPDGSDINEEMLRVTCVPGIARFLPTLAGLL